MDTDFEYRTLQGEFLILKCPNYCIVIIPNGFLVNTAYTSSLCDENVYSHCCKTKGIVPHSEIQHGHFSVID